uniref:Uncharacterized protein n=1 Tax=Arundo donax TaxID=35708 RepID=A0A0A8ZRK0_ARUDO
MVKILLYICSYLQILYRTAWSLTFSTNLDFPTTNPIFCWQ